MEKINKRWEEVTAPIDPASIIGVHENEPAAAAFELLRERNFLALPVYGTGGLNVVGLIDLLDICTYISDFFTTFSDIMTHRTFDATFNKKLHDKTVKDLMNYSGMNAFHPIVAHGTFEDILRALSQRGCHRVCMLDGEGKFGRLVTQSEVIRFISLHLEDFEEVLSASLLKARLVCFGSISVSPESTLEEAFSRIVKGKVSAVPVVKNSSVIGTISVRDIRKLIARLAHPSLSIGKTTVEHFLEEISEDKMQRSVISCTEEETVRNVVTRLHSNKVHRLYVLNDDRLVGVVSLTDVLAYILHKKVDYEVSKWEAYVQRHIAAPAAPGITSSSEVSEEIPKPESPEDKNMAASSADDTK